MRCFVESETDYDVCLAALLDGERGGEAGLSVDGAKRRGDRKTVDAKEEEEEE